jgi:hypothetical protein
MTAILTWIKNNILLSLGIGLVLIIVFFGTGVKKLFGGRLRIRHRRKVYATPRRRTRRTSKTMRRSLPRSVGTQRASGKGYPKVGGGYIPFKRNKNGSIKKAQFVSGTVAAKRRMAALRRAR